MTEAAVRAIGFALVAGLAASVAKSPDGVPPEATLPPSGGYL